MESLVVGYDFFPNGIVGRNENPKLLNSRVVMNLLLKRSSFLSQAVDLLCVLFCRGGGGVGTGLGGVGNVFEQLCVVRFFRFVESGFDFAAFRKGLLTTQEKSV